VLSLQTRDTWSAAQVTATVGGLSDVWTCGATENSAVDALNSLGSWANALARPWGGLALFAWNWARNGADAGAKASLTNSGGVWSYTPNAQAQTLLGMAAMVGQVTVTGTSSAAGTWSPGPRGYVALRGGTEWLRDSGQASAEGAVRPGVPGLAPWLARCQTTVEALELARLTDVVQKASHPRRAWLRLSNVARVSESVVAPGDTSGWKLVAFGPVQRSSAGVSLWSVSLDVQGQAV